MASQVGDDVRDDPRRLVFAQAALAAEMVDAVLGCLAADVGLQGVDHLVELGPDLPVLGVVSALVVEAVFEEALSCLELAVGLPKNSQLLQIGHQRRQRRL